MRNYIKETVAWSVQKSNLGEDLLVVDIYDEERSRIISDWWPLNPYAEDFGRYNLAFAAVQLMTRTNLPSDKFQSTLAVMIEEFPNAY